MTSDPPRVTIGDVAERAGVSIATVSRVVNGRYGVAPETLERVQQVIDDLGYESSLVARSLRSQRTNIIGILVHDIEPYSTEILKGAAKAINKTEYDMIVYSAGRHGHEGWERRSLSRLSGTLIDGAVLVTPTVVDVASTQPVVAVDPHVGGASVPTVDAQNYEGAKLAAEHLISLGHRRIGFLGGRPDLESARRRDAGFRAALDQAGIEVNPTLIREGGYTEAASAQPAAELLGLADRPTAIFAANDLSAIQVLRTASELGLRVPDDLSVVGFDNIPESALTNPVLTTINQPMHAIGGAAVRLLVDLIDHGATAGEDPIHLTLPTELVVRQSCGPPSTGENR